MEHKTLEAKATATDLGQFVALAATYSIDRGNERIVPGAFKATIERWQASAKMIPVHWDHSGNPEDIIGTIDPSTMAETAEGLQVSGKLDLQGSSVAKEAWRLMKADSVSLSFGYMVTDSAEAKDGVLELKTIDLFEVSVTPAPMNPDTRFLALKSVTAMSPAEIHAEIQTIRERLDELSKSLAPETVTEVTGDVEDAPKEEPDNGPTSKASDEQTDELAEWDSALLEARRSH